MLVPAAEPELQFEPAVVYVFEFESGSWYALTSGLESALVWSEPGR